MAAFLVLTFPCSYSKRIVMAFAFLCQDHTVGLFAMISPCSDFLVSLDHDEGQVLDVGWEATKDEGRGIRPEVDREFNAKGNKRGGCPCYTWLTKRFLLLYFDIIQNRKDSIELCQQKKTMFLSQL